MIVYNNDSDLEVSDTCVRIPLLISVELNITYSLCNVKEYWDFFKHLPVEVIDFSILFFEYVKYF